MSFDSPIDQPVVKEKRDSMPFHDGDNLSSARSGEPTKDRAAPTVLAENAAATKRLEESKTIPPLTLANSSASRKDWTVAILLAASVPGNPDVPKGWGVDHQLKELKALAKETEGTSVSYIIHADRPMDKHGNACEDSKKTEETADCEKSATDKGIVKTERYIAHDGKLDRLPDVHYKNSDADITALLKESQKLTPSAKLELVLQSHGMGVDGIQTNQGHITLQHLTRDIGAGLKGSGRDKIDVLNYDSCNMAEAKVLEDSKQIAKDVVASSAVEGTTPKGDGQDLVAEIKILTANSKLSGVDLGNNIVNLARIGKNGEGEASGTPTLTNFDLSKHDDFRAKLDHLGNVLADSVKGSEEFKTLLKTIDKVSIPETGEDETEKHNRDLKDFAQHLLEDARSGKLKTNSKQIEQAATQFITAYDSFATSQFGDNQAGYDKTGGMTVFLPSREILDTKTMAHLGNPLYDLDKKMTQYTDPEKAVDLDDKPLIDKTLGPAHDALSHMWMASGISERKEIDSAWNSVNMAKNSDDMAKAYKHLQELTHGYEFGLVGKKTEAMMAPFVKRAQKDILRAPHEEVTPGWDRFIKTMIDQAR